MAVGGASVGTLALVGARVALGCAMAVLDVLDVACACVLAAVALAASACAVAATLVSAVGGAVVKVGGK